MKNKKKIITITSIFLVMMCLFAVGCDVEDTYCREDSSLEQEPTKTPEKTETSTTATVKPEDTTAKPDTETTPTPETPQPNTSIHETTKPITSTTPKPQEPFYTDFKTALKDLSNNTTTNANATQENAIVEIDIKNKKLIFKRPITISESFGISSQCTIDINGQKITFADNACIGITKNANVTIQDTVGGGIMQKNITSNNNVNLIKSSGNLKIKNGTFSISSKKSGTIKLIQIETGTLEINGGQFSISAPIADSYITDIDTINNLTINGGNFNILTESGSAYIIDGYMPSGSVAEININGGNFVAKSNTGDVKGIHLSKGKNLTISNAKVNVTTKNSIGAFGISSSALELYSFTNVTINSGTYIATHTDKASTMESYALYESGNKQVTINGGNFYSWFSMIHSNTIINDCIFSGAYVGVQLNGRNTEIIINGGTFEGPWHGGIYVCNKSTKISNAILGSPKYSESYLAKATDFVPMYEDGTKWDGTLYSCIYIGGPNNDVTVYMDNCKLVNTKNLKTEYSIVLTSNYGHKNSTLYIKNTKTDKKIRVDGLNENQCQGHLYVQENVTYNGIFGDGYVEEITK